MESETVQDATASESAINMAEQLFAILQQQVLSMNAETLEHLENIFASCNILVRRTSNSLRPVNKLPPEILGLIFCHIPRPYLSHSKIHTSESTLKDPEDVIPTSHVCHHWRAVALCTPNLWVDLMRSPPFFVNETIMQRSKAMPLKVLLCGSNPRVGPLFSSHGSRIQELSLWHVNLMKLWSYLTIPAPNLEQLNITCITAESPDEPKTRLPETLFDGIAPRLRCLSLAYVPRLPDNQFHSLTFLHLCSNYAQPVLSQFLSLLSGSPNLVEIALSVHHIMVHNDGTIEDDSRIISLRQLRILEFRSMDPDEIALILSHLHFPVTTIVLLSISDLPLGNHLPQQLLSLSTIQNATKLSITREQAGCEISVIGSSASAGIHIKCWQWFTWVENDISFMNLIDTLPTIVPATSITELCVMRRDSCIGVEVASPIGRLVQDFPALKELTIEHSDTAVSMDVLMALKATGQLRCQGLDTLHILCYIDVVSVNDMIEILVKSQARLEFKHLIIEEFKQQPPEAWAQLGSYFETVEIRPSDSRAPSRFEESSEQPSWQHRDYITFE